MESFEKLEVPAIREDLRRTSALATRRSDTNKAQIDTSSPSQIGRSPKLGRMRVLARGQTAPADKLLLWLVREAPDEVESPRPETDLLIGWRL